MMSSGSEELICVLDKLKKSEKLDTLVDLVLDLKSMNSLAASLFILLLPSFGQIVTESGRRAGPGSDGTVDSRGISQGEPAGIVLHQAQNK